MSSSIRHERVAAFLRQEVVPFSLGGRATVVTSTFDDINPSDGSTLATVAAAEPSIVDAVVDQAQDALHSAAWVRMTPADRANILWRLSELVLRDRDELIELDALDCGLPISASHQVEAVVEDLRYFAGWTTKLDGRVAKIGLPGFHVYTEIEPVGVCVGITSWNFPLEAFSGKVGPALAAGNSVILKPSKNAPLSALWLAMLAAEAGVPAGVLTVIPGPAELARRLVQHAGVAKVAFTGSTTVGMEIAARAAGQLKRVSMELGGKSPAIVTPDAHLERAIEGIADAVFGHSGQNCVAPSRVLVHRSIFDEVAARLVERGRALRQGPATSTDMEIGPVISRRRRDEILDYIGAADKLGAEIHCGGGTPEGLTGGWYVAPTVLSRVPTDAAPARDEIFGPVACLFDYDDIDDAITQANSSSYGLSASVWTSSIEVAQRCAQGLDAGVVWINGHALYDSAVSFGGFKASGFGRELGEETMREYTRVKTIWQGRPTPP